MKPNPTNMTYNDFSNHILELTHFGIDPHDVESIKQFMIPVFGVPYNESWHNQWMSENGNVTAREYIVR